MRRDLRPFNLLFFTAFATLIVVSAFVSGLFAGRAAERRGQAANLGLVAEVRAILDGHFLGSLPTDSQIQYGAVRGMLTAVNDPYTIFLEPPSQELETQQLQGQFGGIGVNISRNEAGETVMSPFADLPAARAGIIEGALLVAVDGVPITPLLSIDDVVAMVRGEAGTQVTITVSQNGTIGDFTLKREVIEIPSVSWRVLPDDPAVGLLRISRFSEKTPNEAARGLDALLAQGITYLIIDLRDNGGGLLTSVINTAGLFLDGGAIMIEQKRGEPEKVYTAPENTDAPDVPLAVLVNHGTASAAEILAGALRDGGRAPLIGQTTYGKGSVQLIFTLSDRSSVHVTSARWFTPLRAPIDGVGLQPDIEVQPSTDGTDAEIKRAIDYFYKRG